MFRTGTPKRARRSLAALAASGALVLAACGGSDGADDGSSGADAAETSADSDATAADDAAPTPARTGAGLLDLSGPDIVASAEIETNELPDVVVDDLTNGRKVNFRNLVPQDKPILLWMWAPH